MKLLLHGCCADCTLKFIASSNGDFDEVAVYYYNPNIHPRSEYQSRLKAIKQVLEEKGVKLMIPDWKPGDYFNVVKSKVNRCPKCWNLRIGETVKYAKNNGFTHVATTLVTSQYQDTDKVKKIGEKLCKEAGLEFFVPKVVCKELETSGFYKQFYCGCCYSMVERLEEKFGRISK